MTLYHWIIHHFFENEDGVFNMDLRILQWTRISTIKAVELSTDLNFITIIDRNGKRHIIYK